MREREPSHTTMTTPVVKTTLNENGVYEIVLNRPEKKNSLSPESAEEMANALAHAIANDDVKIIIFRGENGFFCAGLDLKLRQQIIKETGKDWTFGEHWKTFHKLQYSCEKPTCAVVEGGAIAGGSGLAFSCDFIYTSPKSYIWVREVEYGMAAPMNILWMTTRWSTKLSKELVVGGQRMYGEELMEKGIAVSCDPNPLESCREWANKIAKTNDLNAMVLANKMINSLTRTDDSFDALNKKLMIMSAKGGSKAPPKLNRAKM